MRAALYHGPGDVRVQTVPDPHPPGPGQLLLEVSAASLCGTDLTEFVRGPVMVPLHRPHPASGHQGPTILGHEFTGRVSAVGTAVDPRLIGQRVVPGSGSWCGHCARCAEGRINLCARYFLYGIHHHGGLAEYALVPAAMCQPVPEICPPQSAALAQPLAVALHAVTRSQLAAGETVVVIGVGGIGSYLVAAALTHRPGQLIAVEVHPARRERARTLGAHLVLDPANDPVETTLADLTAGAGADLVIEASGTPTGLAQALRLARHGGRVHLVGLHPPPTPIDLHHLVLHEINLLTTNGHVCPTDLPAAIELLASTDLARHVRGDTITLDELVPHGLAAMAEGRAPGKVVITIPGRTDPEHPEGDGPDRALPDHHPARSMTASPTPAPAGAAAPGAPS